MGEGAGEKEGVGEGAGEEEGVSVESWAMLSVI